MIVSHGQIFQYNGTEFSKEKFNTAELVSSFQLDKLPKDKITWINVYINDEFESVEQFCLKQNYDTLVIQNLRERDSRPQFEDYDSYLFFSIRSAIPSASGSLKIHQEQLSFILGENYLISFQSKPSDYFGSVRDRLENKKGITRDKGADFLLYKLLDAIIDNYYNVLDANTTAIEDLETRVAKNTSPQMLTSIELQKRKLIELRRIVLPLKEIAISLEGSKSPLFKRETKHYYSDLKQNCISVIEEVESNKNALEGLTNVYYAAQGQRMNEIMKVLTIVSTIFIPLTFIAGIYGMNFRNMPELAMQNGYFITLGVMVLIAILLLVYFAKRGWLNNKN